MQKIFSFLFLGLFGISNAFAAGGVYINEFVAQNTLGIVDEAGQHEDWVELYNSNNFEVNLEAWHLTDDPAEPAKWSFPAGTKIAPKGFILIWADDDLKQGPLHANFKLSKDGEFIGLYLPGALIAGDTISFGPQKDNISIGRISDGASSVKEFNSPTPGYSNSAVSVDELSKEGSFVYPNPAFDYITIPSVDKAVIYNLSGNEILRSSNTQKINISNLPAGAYLIKFYSESEIRTDLFIKK